MPRESKFAVGEVIITDSCYDEGRKYTGEKGDICKIIKEEYDSYHYAEVIYTTSKRVKIGHRSDYLDAFVHKAKRAEVIGYLENEAKRCLEVSNSFFKKAALYQKYPTVEAEVAGLMDSLSEGDLTEEEAMEKIGSISFEIDNSNFSVLMAEQLNKIKLFR